MAEYGFQCKAIITGSVDSFCLACEEHLKCERDAAAHITKPVHHKNLLAVPYMNNYYDDQIRKVKKGYFCELCNLLLPTATKVGLHVADTLHVDNKVTKLLKRVGNTVIALGNISISERAWHGLMEDTCTICNVEYDNEDIHKNAPTHIIRLIQCKVQYGSNNSIYRLIDNDTFQCITCNTVISLQAITEHFNNSDHLKLYSECLVSANTEKLNVSPINYRDNNENQDNIDAKIAKKKNKTQIEMANDENKKKILNSVNVIQRSDINIDFETESAFCKKCMMSLDFKYSLIEQHMQEHVHKPKKMSDPALSYPTADKNHNKMRLTQCDESKSDHKTSQDSNKNTRNTETNNFIKQSKPMGMFLIQNKWRNVKLIEHVPLYIFNEEILVPGLSFMMLYNHGSMTRCEACQVNIKNDNVDNHLFSPRHIDIMGEMPIITCFETEFVREIRPGLYHCGYCHSIVSDWGNLLDHLRSPEHTSKKLTAKSLLDRLLREERLIDIGQSAH